MTSARDLADRFHQRWLTENPFAASMYGIPGYDDLMPDESEEGAQAWRAEAERFLGEADAIDPGPLTPADVVTLDCTREMATQELTMIDMARAEHTVTAMQYAGPAVLMAVAARTVLLDAAAAEAYLTRLRRSGAWLDQTSERLRAGARKGRLPVAPLIEQAITWAEAVLAGPVPGPVLAPQPPQGWAGAAAWEDERRRVAAEFVKPALVRWVATIRELLPRARPSDQAGLVYLPGGADDYARAVRAYTTLPLHPEQLHQTGLDHIAALEARAVKLGTGLGLSGLDGLSTAWARRSRCPPSTPRSWTTARCRCRCWTAASRAGWTGLARPGRAMSPGRLARPTSMTEPKTYTLDVPGAVLSYDIRANDTSTEPVLLIIGSPAASTRIVIGAGAQSGTILPGRAAVAVAERLGTSPVTFPGGHDGFLGGEYGSTGEPDAFAATLRTVLAD